MVLGPGMLLLHGLLLFGGAAWLSGGHRGAEPRMQAALALLPCTSRSPHLPFVNRAPTFTLVLALDMRGRDRGQPRRRRSNRPGNSQAKGPPMSSSLESRGIPLTEGAKPGPCRSDGSGEISQVI